MLISPGVLYCLQIYQIYLIHSNINMLFVFLCIYFLLLDPVGISDIEIMESLFYCFQGLDSKWIVFNKNENQFVVIANVSFHYIFKYEILFVLIY